MHALAPGGDHCEAMGKRGIIKYFIDTKATLSCVIILKYKKCSEVIMKDKKYLSEVLDASYFAESTNNKFCIISGVGSGKNYFINEELSKYGNIIYVSSRRAKVNELLLEEICKEKIDTNYIDTIFTTTNHGIELLVKNKRFNTGIKNIASYYNYIVIDEAHSILTDASFTNSSFHLFSFVNYFATNYPKIKIILMTGTPEPIENVILKNYNYEIIDKREECFNVIPQSIQIIPKATAINILKGLPKEDRAIYYSNSAKKMINGEKSLLNLLCKDGDFKTNEISLCMNNEKAKELNKIFTQLDLEKESSELKEYLCHYNKLPEGKRVLLTTSTLKEGVNIKDDKVKIAFCESHLLSDIQQFAGRVRKGLKTLYIISDATQHNIAEDEINRARLKIHFQHKADFINLINAYLNNCIKDTSSPIYSHLGYKEGYIDMYSLYEGDYSIASMGNTAVSEFIEIIEKDNDYIRFNYLNGEFEYNKNKIVEQIRIHENLKENKWLENLRQFADSQNIHFTDLASDNDIDIESITTYLKEREQKKLTDNDKTQFLSNLTTLLLLNPNVKNKTINNKLTALEIPFQINSGVTTQKEKKRYIMVVSVKK